MGKRYRKSHFQGEKTDMDNNTCIKYCECLSEYPKLLKTAASYEESLENEQISYCSNYVVTKL
jgi:hypothetical protein